MYEWLVSSKFALRTNIQVHEVSSSFVFAFALSLHLAPVTSLIYLSSLISLRQIAIFRLSYFLVTFLCFFLANNFMNTHIYSIDHFTDFS